MLKKILKTMVAVATLIAGSQTWGATFEDEGGNDVKGGIKTVSTRFASLTPVGTAGAVSATVNMVQHDSSVYVMSASGDAVTLTSVTATKDSKLYLMGFGGVTLTAATGPSSGKAYIHLMGPTAALPVGLDGTKFKVIADFLGAVAGTTLTIPAGDFAPDIELKGSLTPATATIWSGELSGSGQLRAPASLTTLKGKMTKFTGDIVTGAAMSIKYLPLKGGIDMSHSVTVTDSGTLGRLIVTGGGTFTANANVTINSLTLRTAALTLAPAAGVTIKIKKIESGADQNITHSGAGVVEIVEGSTSGTITVSGGGTLK